MATLADGGRIADNLVVQEIERLRKLWGDDSEIEDTSLSSLLTVEQIAELDLFDRLQLVAVISVCRECHSLSEAGRRLFSVSRTQRGSTNDADRLRKILGRFGLEWSNL